MEPAINTRDPNPGLGFNIDPSLQKKTPFKGLNIRIPILIPIKGRGFINQGSALGFRA